MQEWQLESFTEKWNIRVCNEIGAFVTLANMLETYP